MICQHRFEEVGVSTWGNLVETHRIILKKNTEITEILNSFCLKLDEIGK